MKNNVRLLTKILACAVVTLCSHLLVAQNGARYQEPVFSKVLVTSNIKYSSAIREGQTEPTLLYLDFYEPSGDNLEARPLVITVFGGAFVSGSRDHVDMKEYGNRLAKLGYTVASIDYRLLPILYLNATSLMRTAYMAAQDISSAVRFLKLHSSEYRIDTNNIFLLGNSAGSIAAIHEVFLTEDERPSETFMEPDLGPLHGEGFHDYAHISPKVAGVISHWGGVMDLGVIDSDEYVPLCMIHGTNDNVVPYDSGYCYSESTSYLMPFMYGSHTLATLLDNIGVTDYEFHPFEGLGHCFYIWGLAFLHNERFNNCFEITKKFLYNHLKDGSTVAVTQSSSLHDFHIYPNPADDVVFVDIKDDTEISSLALYDNLGRLVLSDNTIIQNGKKISIPVKNLPAGLYLLHMLDKNHNSSIAKIVIR